MNENPYLNEESRSGAAGMSGFMLGAIVGAGVALLFAPATGTDTRRKLGETAKRLGTAARERVQEGKEKIQDRFQSERQGMESGRPGNESNRPGMENRAGFESGRREPVPSAGSTTNPGQTGRTTTPGRTNP